MSTFGRLCLISRRSDHGLIRAVESPFWFSDVRGAQEVNPPIEATEEPNVVRGGVARPHSWVAYSGEREVTNEPGVS